MLVMVCFINSRFKLFTVTYNCKGIVKPTTPLTVSKLGTKESRCVEIRRLNSIPLMFLPFAITMTMTIIIISIRARNGSRCRRNGLWRTNHLPLPYSLFWHRCLFYGRSLTTMVMVFSLSKHKQTVTVKMMFLKLLMLVISRMKMATS